MKCGCKIDLNFIDKLQGQGLEFSIIHCPIHKAAPALVAVAQGLIDFDNNALMDDHVPLELIEKAKQALAQVGETNKG